MSKKNISRIIFAFIIIIAFVGVFFIFPSRSAVKDGDFKVGDDEELTYYIDVLYDGIDVDSVSSSGASRAKVYSDYIYIEDKLPEGLTFDGFSWPADSCLIGAVSYENSDISCPGYVVGVGGTTENDCNGGISYDEDTGVVSFKIKDLQAGCKVTVGIKVKTPFLGDAERIDFYNSAYAWEDTFTARSNTVHVFMGEDSNLDLYNVTYQYSGTVPDDAPSLPTVTAYEPGSVVGVENDVYLEGYRFSGWSSNDVTVSGNNTFTMPSQNVVFTGNFSLEDTYSVTYQIEGNYPEMYEVPAIETHAAGSNVIIDQLMPGEIIGDFQFNGWHVEGVDFAEEYVQSYDSGKSFIMPRDNVTIVGSFSTPKYSVEYVFQGDILPSNYLDLLPITTYYYPGQTVKLASKNISADGYKFLGWYSENEFSMPSENVIIAGEWAVPSLSIDASFDVSIVDEKYTYTSNEDVEIQLSVTNNEDFDLRRVWINKVSGNSVFTAPVDDSYTIVGDNYVYIDEIEAGATFTLTALYNTGNVNISYVETDTFKLTGAVGETNDDYSLDSKDDYEKTVNSYVSNFSINVNNVGSNEYDLHGSSFEVYSDDNLTQLVGLSTPDSSDITGLRVGTTYYLKQTVVPLGYVCLPVLELAIDDDANVTVQGKTFSVEDSVVSIDIVNDVVNIFPDTGGIGNLPFVIAGFLFIILGSLAFAYYMLKKKGLINRKSKGKRKRLFTLKRNKNKKGVDVNDEEIF